jgi:hypothetical protein
MSQQRHWFFTLVWQMEVRKERVLRSRSRLCLVRKTSDCITHINTNFLANFWNPNADTNINTDLDALPSRHSDDARKI